MGDFHLSIPDYLRPPCEHLWRWEDNGDSIIWCADPITDADESTAAFSPQLHRILNELNDRLGGLPPLACVLMVIDSCGERWSLDNCTTRVARIAKASSRKARRLDGAGGPTLAIVRGFAEIHALPKELRNDPYSHIAILTYVFHEARGYLFESIKAQAADVLESILVLGTERDPRWADSARPAQSSVRAKRAMEAMTYIASRKIDEESIRLWRKTNVGSMPEPAPIEEPPKSRDPIGQTLRDLAEDDEWGGVAGAAAAVASLLTLPRKPSDPEPLPLGGVSDVTNRGQPERLLMTELAQDPIVMLARIANGQALYLRRETPPGPSPQFRPVLIEAGIRTWGTIRLQIASVALAIAAAEERRGATSAKLMTVAGHRIIDEDFTTVEGVIEHLGRLEPDEHPGLAVNQWIRDLNSDDQLYDDPILIVSAATDRDTRFQRALDELTSGYMIARIERDATVTLLRRTPLGDDVLQSVAIEAVTQGQSDDVDALTKIRTPESSLALFLDVEPCPLRFTDPLNGSWIGSTETPGLFTITRDRRLLYFDRSGAGAVHLVDRLPVGHVLAHEFSDPKLSLVIGDGQHDHHLVEVDLRTSDVHQVALSGGSQNLTYEFDQGSLYRFGSRVELLDRQLGACLATDDLAGWAHIGGPVLYKGRNVRLVSREGAGIIYHEISDPMPDLAEAGFAIRRQDGVVFLISKSYRHLVMLDGMPTSRTIQPARIIFHVQQPLKIVYTSTDGNVVVVSDPRSNHRAAIDLKAASVSDRGLLNHRQLLSIHDPPARCFLDHRNVLSRSTAIRIVNGESIAVMKHRRPWVIEYDEGDSKLVMRAMHPQNGAETRSFGRSMRLDTPLGRTRWSLRQTEFGINRIVADSRGLLHLRRGDDGTEVTLMLHMPHVSGWTSWGERFGDGYFLGGETRAASTKVARWLKEFAQRCSQSN